MPNPFEMIKITFTWTFAFLFYFWPIVLVAFILGLTKFIIRKKLPNLFYFLNNRRSSYSETKVTRQALALYEALEDRNINCELEKWDGYKHVDIAIESARLYIEVDGSQHYTNKKQMFSDWQRSHYSKMDGYHTIHIPNRMIDNDVDDVADAIADIINKI